jgi:hypothetical protein
MIQSNSSSSLSSSVMTNGGGETKKSVTVSEWSDLLTITHAEVCRCCCFPFLPLVSYRHALLPFLSSSRFSSL